MAVLDKKVSQLVTLANVSSDDLLMVVNDPSGSPTSRKISAGSLFGNIAFDVTVQDVNVAEGIKDRMQVANVTSAIAASKTDTLDTATRNGRIDGVIVHSANVLTTTSAQTAFFTTASANIVYSNTVYANVSLILPNPTDDPATSNASTESVDAGTIFYSNTYLYIATDENTIKRVALSDF